MKTIIINGEILTPSELIKGSRLIIEDGLISCIEEDKSDLFGNSTVIDADGMYICPGLIDIHFHGALGKDTMDSQSDAIRTFADFCVKHGVTSFYPTTWSASQNQIHDSIMTVKGCMKYEEGAQILGVHLEGPYINLNYRGAQSADSIRVPNKSEYSRWFESDVVKLITCAPEVDRGFEFIKDAINNRVKISIGHSHSSYMDVIHAADLGANQATHIFNGMPSIHHRDPGIVVGVLNDDRIFTQIICDGIHLHPAIVLLIARVKTPSRSILITDSIRGTGLSDGQYDNNGQVMLINNGVARTVDGVLSGSTLTLEQAIKNMIRFTNYPLTDILQMATKTPALAMGIANKKGVIQKGADADLVFFDNDFIVQKTFIRGILKYSK